MIHHASHSVQPATTPLTPAEAKRHAQITEQTRKWVADAFYGTLLKQMRESPFKSKLFDGGPGGEMFSSMLDQQLTQRMSKGAPDKLVKSIVSKIEGSKAAAAYLKQAKQSRLPADLAQQARSYVTPTR